jgi:hypothetical protein
MQNHRAAAALVTGAEAPAIPLGSRLIFGGLILVFLFGHAGRDLRHPGRLDHVSRALLEPFDASGIIVGTRK